MAVSLLAVSGVLEVLGWLGMPLLIAGTILRHRGPAPRVGDGLFHLGLVGLACLATSEAVTGVVTGEIPGLGDSPIRFRVERGRNPWGFWIDVVIHGVFAVSLMTYSAIRVVRLVFHDRPARRPGRDATE